MILINYIILAFYDINYSCIHPFNSWKFLLQWHQLKPLCLRIKGRGLNQDHVSHELYSLHPLFFFFLNEDYMKFCIDFSILYTIMLNGKFMMITVQAVCCFLTFILRWILTGWYKWICTLNAIELLQAAQQESACNMISVNGFLHHLG